MARILEPMLTAQVGDQAIAASAVARLDWGLSSNEGILILGSKLDMAMIQDPAAGGAWVMALSTDPRAAALDWDNGSAWALRSDIINLLMLDHSFATAVGINTGPNGSNFVPLGNMVDQGYLITRNVSLILDEVNGAASIRFSAEIYYKRIFLTDAEVGGAIVVRGR